LLVLSGGKVGPAGADALLTLADPADSATFSPDGNRLVYRSGQRTVLLDLTTQKATTWPAGDPTKITWASDSSRLAYQSGDSVFTAFPDGSDAKVIAKGQAANTELAWLGAGQVLVSSASGLYLVHPDGSELASLSSLVYGSPSGSATPDRFGFSRGGVLWLADLKVVTPGRASLDQGYAVVTAFETARISREGSRASAYLTASAARTTTSIITAGEPHLKRFFLVSSQQVRDDGTAQRVLVRLIRSGEQGAEVRYFDEQLVVIAAGQSTELKIDALSDGPVRPLGKGPNVNAVQVKPSGLVLVFDSDLNPATVAANVRISALGGDPLTAVTSYSQRQVTIVATLVPGRRYKLVVGADLKDIQGQPLAGGSYEYEFQASAISG
ncbi:MAG: Ig-like domain-containing protein, partial [Candidatus Dormibacteraeota bacterium]|nr:Ig-like domain-containing protein [Candidatus Dormibacteraeota bacterium]